MTGATRLAWVSDIFAFLSIKSVEIKVGSEVLMSDNPTIPLASNGGVQGQRHDIAVSVEKVRGALEALRFGSITLTVHDARVVQIDVTEKTRLTA
jgi:hypothetical protein